MDYNVSIIAQAVIRRGITCIIPAASYIGSDENYCVCINGLLPDYFLKILRDKSNFWMEFNIILQVIFTSFA